jgi:hypothetical protein
MLPKKISPTTIPTTMLPTTIPTTIPTTMLPTTISTTIPTTMLPTTISTTIPTTMLPTTIPTTISPTPISYNIRNNIYKNFYNNVDLSFLTNDEKFVLDFFNNIDFTLKDTDMYFQYMLNGNYIQALTRWKNDIIYIMCKNYYSKSYHEPLTARKLSISDLLPSTTNNNIKNIKTLIGIFDDQTVGNFTNFIDYRSIRSYFKGEIDSIQFLAVNPIPTKTDILGNGFYDLFKNEWGSTVDLNYV